MKKTVKLSVIWILLYVPSILVMMGVIFYLFQNHEADKYKEIKIHIGEKIEIGNLLDLENNRVNLQCNSDFTIIDFWFKGCAACLEEMKHFTPLISGMENKLTVISISIDDRENWKPLFGKDSPLPFLAKEMSNWKHFMVADTTFTDSKNRVVTGNGSRFLMEKFGINAFPSYLVLDKNGVLIDIPANGVNYIKKIKYNKSAFRMFWSIEKFKRQRVAMLAFGFAIYSIIYWVIIIILLLIRKRRKKQSC